VFLAFQVARRNPNAFTWWLVTLVGNTLFIVMHLAAYPGNANPTL
jgi:hypothetical protein